jgi:predicted O-methyltransferase YrrM
MTDNELLAICAPIGGWMYPAELIWLHRRAANHKLIVELGVWEGRSTAALASGTPGKVYAIDHWLGSPEEHLTFHRQVTTPLGRASVMEKARRNLQRWTDAGIVELVEADASAAVERFTNMHIDMLFIDAGHDYGSVCANFDAYSPLMAIGGLVSGHDRDWPGVNKAIHERFGKRVKHGPGSLWYVR